MRKSNGMNPESAHRKPALNFAIVGGGKACKSYLQLLRGEPFQSLNIEIVGVCDINPAAEGLRLAHSLGLYITQNFQDLFLIKDLDGLIELTDDREVLPEVIRHKPKGVGVMDHNMGRLFWDLFRVSQQLKSAQERVVVEKTIADFLIQQTHERIVVLNPDFTIVEANEAYLQAVGKSKDEVKTAHCYEITHGLSSPCSAWQPEMGCPMVETMRTGQSAHVIHEHPTSDGRAIYCDLVTYPVRDPQGKIVKVIEIWRDITQALSSRWEKRLKAMEADMRKLIQEDRMISMGKLAASCVHEINNPIQGLLTFSRLMQEILMEGRPDEKRLEEFKEYLSLMCNELERCGDIVSGLLSFSRESGVETKDVDLNEVLHSVIALTRHKMELQDIELRTYLSGAPLLVRGDVNQYLFDAPT